MAARNSVNMKDVATLAGVSVGTVSNVLNSPDLVSPATQERVRRAIDKLGWVRNESARQLRAGRSRSVGMVVIDIANPFFTDVVLGAEDHFYEAGYAVHVGNSAQTAEREVAHLALFEEQRVRGILVAPIREMAERIAELRRRGIAVVLVDRMSNTNDSCSVGVDDLEGGRLAVQHLIDQGHRSIAFVGGPSTLHQVRDRRMGAELATARAGDPVVLLAISTPSLDVEAGIRTAADLAALPGGERPTSVFAANDLVAIGLLQGFVTAGVAVPDDMAIIGYDDIAFAAAAAVPLSSVRQPRAELGRRAAELLLAEIEAADTDTPHEHEQVRFVPELVVRRSTVTPTSSRRTA
ncbi:MAG TPA: LacI family DNA-binding transcriptional regulator [Propionibacteriaceae bacterium]|nr:LacI family DNA-binding transcriptional regulator [Propionibacteriaceae bacterium]